MALSYTSVDRMLEAFPRLGEISAITSAQLYTYAGDAEALVNARVANRYTVPVSGQPPLLVTLTTDLAVYRVLALRVFTSERMNESMWPDRYKESSALLDQIASGDIPLVTTSGDLVGENGALDGEVWSSKMAYIPTFSEAPWSISEIDRDKAKDELDNRGWGWDEIVR
jgi:phage gp36-like protein